MRKFEITLPDEIVIALEKMFTPEEIPLMINQAVLREVEEWCHQHGINYAQYAPSDDVHSSAPQDEDANAHEWTS